MRAQAVVAREGVHAFGQLFHVALAYQIPGLCIVDDFGQSAAVGADARHGARSRLLEHDESGIAVVVFCDDARCHEYVVVFEHRGHLLAGYASLEYYFVLNSAFGGEGLQLFLQGTLTYEREGRFLVLAGDFREGADAVFKTFLFDLAADHQKVRGAVWARERRECRGIDAEPVDANLALGGSQLYEAVGEFLRGGQQQLCRLEHPLVGALVEQVVYGDVRVQQYAHVYAVERDDERDSGFFRGCRDERAVGTEVRVDELGTAFPDDACELAAGQRRVVERALQGVERGNVIVGEVFACGVEPAGNHVGHIPLGMLHLVVDEGLAVGQPVAYRHRVRYFCHGFNVAFLRDRPAKLMYICMGTPWTRSKSAFILPARMRRTIFSRTSLGSSAARGVSSARAFWTWQSRARARNLGKTCTISTGSTRAFRCGRSFTASTSCCA